MYESSQSIIEPSLLSLPAPDSARQGDQPLAVLNPSTSSMNDARLLTAMFSSTQPKIVQPQSRSLPLNITFDSSEPQFSVDDSVEGSDESHEVPIQHPPSLDLDGGDDHESHFLGSGAFSGMTLQEINPENGPFSSGYFSLRQVSSDPRHPAFFVKSSSFMYGRGPNLGRDTYDAVCNACVNIPGDTPSRALSKFQRITLPALPFVNSKRLETACLGLAGSGPVPYAILAGIIAHSTPHLPELRPLHQELWSHVLLSLEDEYRQPRLQTVQMALIVLSSRPSDNVGQADIGLARAIGTAHLLGLHVDSVKWLLPRWECTIRKRIWWTLFLHDKWRAVIHGRPSILHRSNNNVSLPTIDDGDWGAYAPPSEKQSLETFIANCRLAQIVDLVLVQCYSPLQTSADEDASRFETLQSLAIDVEGFSKSLPDAWKWNSNSAQTSIAAPTGTRSLQLSVLGLDVIVHRLMLDTLVNTSIWQSTAILRNAARVCHNLVDFTLSLSEADRDMFWMPYSSFHLSNAVCVLLRVAFRSRLIEPDLVTAAISDLSRLVQYLIPIFIVSEWDVAVSALKRILTLLSTASPAMEEVRPVLDLVAEHCGASDSGPLNLRVSNNSIEMAGNAISIEDPSLQDTLCGLDSMSWLGNDMSWLDFELPLGTTQQ
ncbi:hypothetical protein P7C73_g1161, partial [Tremellales sp. Uapishka_1]